MTAHPLITLIAIIILAIVFVAIVMWVMNRGTSNSNCPVAAPLNVRATPSAGMATVTWINAPNATGYNIYVAKSNTVTRGMFDSKIVQASNPNIIQLSPGTYYIRVSSLRKCGNNTVESDLSPTVTVTVPNCPIALLTPPTILVLENSAPGTVELEYSNVSGAVSYNIYRAQNRAVTPSSFDEKVNSQDTNFFFNGLSSNTMQSFVVTSVNACGDEGAPSQMGTITVDCTIPPGVDITKVVPAVGSSLLMWAASPIAVTGYTVYIRQGTDVTKTSFDDKEVLANNVVSFTFTGLAPLTIYSIGVTSSNACGESTLNFAVIKTPGLNGQFDETFDMSGNPAISLPSNLPHVRKVKSIPQKKKATTA